MKSKNLRVLLLALLLLLQSRPVSAIEDEQGWIEDDSVQEIVPGTVRNLVDTPSPKAWATDDAGSSDRDPQISEQQPEETSEPPAPTLANQFATQGDLTPAAPLTKSNWFFDPPPVPWLNSLGRGVRKIGTGSLSAAQSTTDAVSSPQLWNFIGGAAALAGAGYGLYQLNKYSNRDRAPNYGFTNPNQVWVNPYLRNGSLVNGHWRTAPDKIFQNNFSSIGNINPYTGRPGYVYPY